MPTEIASIVQAWTLEVEVKTPNAWPATSYSQIAGSIWRGRKRAKGGIITRHKILLIGEAGREAIIPLEDQTRGASLCFEAERELWLISANKTITNTSERNVMPEIVNAINLHPQISYVIPYANGGIFSLPHIGLVAGAGRELGLILGENNTTSNAYSSLNSHAITNSNARISPSERNSVNVLKAVQQRHIIISYERAEHRRQFCIKNYRSRSQLQQFITHQQHSN